MRARTNQSTMSIGKCARGKTCFWSLHMLNKKNILIQKTNKHGVRLVQHVSCAVFIVQLMTFNSFSDIQSHLEDVTGTLAAEVVLAGQDDHGFGEHFQADRADELLLKVLHGGSSTSTGPRAAC